MLETEDLEKLKQIYYKKTGEALSDQQALEIGTRLLGLFRIILKPIPGETAESDE